VLAILVPVNAAMLLPGGVAEFGVVTSEESPDNPNEVGIGDDFMVDYQMQNSGFLPAVTVLEPASTGVVIDSPSHKVSRGAIVNTSVLLQTPDEPGVYTRHVREYRYLGVLPQSWILTLHGIHPLLALGAINLTIGVPVALLSLSVFGTGRVRLRSRSRDGSGDSLLGGLFR